MSRNKALLALLLALLMASPCALAESENLISSDMIQTNSANYKLFTAELGAYEQTISNAGSEYYPHTYEVRPELDGERFLEYTVEKGQEVRKGDVLAVFSMKVDEARLTELNLQLERAEDDLQQQTELRVDAIEEMEMALPGVTDRYEYEIQALKIKRARVELEQYIYQQNTLIAKTEEIDKIEAEKAGAKLLAPVDGTVTRMTLMREGDRVYTTDALVTIFRTEDKMLRFENSGNNFRYGMKVTVEVGPGSNKVQVSGRVVGADTRVPEAMRTGMIYVAFDEPVEDVRSAKVRANNCYLDNVMIVPRKAVELESGNYFVSKLEDGIVRKRYVNSIVKPGQQIWILQGLEAGDEIIVG